MLQRFLHYRHDHPALLYDSFRTFASHDYRVDARAVALLALVLLLATPVGVVVIGDDPVGDEIAFGITIAVWPVLVERSGWAIRQLHGWPGEDAPEFAQSGFDFPAFLLWSALAVVAWYLIGAQTEWLMDRGNVALGIAWGIALAGMLDASRNAVAFTVSRLGGYPLYGPSARRLGR